MRFPTNKTLAKIAVYGAFGTITAAMYMRYKLEDNFRKTAYYRLAMDALKKHKGATSLLGQPIKEVGFNFGDKDNWCNTKNAQFEMKVKGSKDGGKLFFWATHTDGEEYGGWLLDRLELELKSQPEKRFLLRKAKEQENEVIDKDN